MKPGDHINRRQLAQDLNVSISPVNEAFALLQAEDIIVTIPRKGSFINKLDWREISDLTKVRAALECEAARKYAGELIAKQKGHFMKLAEEVDKAVPRTYEYIIADIKFHRELVNLPGNKYLSKMFEAVITKSLLLAYEVSLVVSSVAGEEVLSHQRLVEALCDAGSEGGGRIVRENIYTGKLIDISFSQQHANGDGELSGKTKSLDMVLSMFEMKTQ